MFYRLTNFTFLRLKRAIFFLCIRREKWYHDVNIVTYEDDFTIMWLCVRVIADLFRWRMFVFFSGVRVALSDRPLFYSNALSALRTRYIYIYNAIRLRSHYLCAAAEQGRAMRAVWRLRRVAAAAAAAAAAEERWETRRRVIIVLASCIFARAWPNAQECKISAPQTKNKKSEKKITSTTRNLYYYTACDRQRFPQHDFFVQRIIFKRLLIMDLHINLTDGRSSWTSTGTWNNTRNYLNSLAYNK